MTVDNKQQPSNLLELLSEQQEVSPGAALSTPQELYRFLRRALALLRWVTVGALLLITLLMPTPSLLGFPTWVLMLLFAGYSLVGDLAKGRMPGRRYLALGAILDLPVAALVYLLAGEPGGPLFVLFFFAVDCAAAILTLRGILLYAGAVTAIVSVIDLVLLLWTPSQGDVRMLFARLLMLALVGIGMVIVTRRLVLEQESARSAVDEAARLAELDEVRAHFIANVSHELRTPLTAARAALGLVETSMVNRTRPDEQQLLSNARRNIERLSILLGDLLTFNQIEAGTLRLEREPLDMRMVVADSLPAVHPLILQKGQILEVALPEPLPYKGDTRQLEQVVVNLLSNAHQHTPPGTRITISGRSTADEVVLSVTDDGPGIPPEQLEAIFQRFFRLPLSEAGSGLGLAIARAVVEMHGGRMWADSEPGKGASFHMALPHQVNDKGVAP